MDVDKVKVWIKDEMKYDKSLPSDDQLRFLCGGALEKLWSHILSHCHSQETVKKVQGNLSIARKKQMFLENSSSLSSTLGISSDGGERDELLLERSNLISKLHETLAKMERLKIAVKSAEEDRRVLHKNKEDYARNIRERRQSALLLTLYIKQVQGLVRKLSGIVEKQKSIQQQLRSKEQATQEQQVFSVGNTVETEGERNLRLAIDLVLQHMLSLMDTLQLPGSKQEIRREILKLLTMVPCSSLETALLKNIQTQISSVCNRRQNLDLLEEAKNMKLKASVSVDGGILTSVREEVDLLYKKHIAVHQELKRAKKRLEKHEAETEKAVEAYTNLTNFQDVQQEMQKCMEKASNECKLREVDKLESQLCELVTKNEDQELILNWVKNAQSNIQDVTSMISALIDSNTQGMQKLKHRQAVMEELIKRLPEVLGKFKSSVQKSFEEPSEMLKTFLQVPVERYCSTLVKGNVESTLVPTPDLYLYRLRSCYPYPSVDETKDEIDGFMVSLNSRQDLCFRVSNLISEIELLRAQNQNVESCQTLSTVLQMADTLRASANQQINDFQPMLAETDSCRSKGLALCEAVDSALQDYRLQGTQAVLSGDQQEVVEGRSFSQWREVLRVAVANTKS